ncbi:SDR family NAD(P)-dependent oxidoreductase [Spirochaeta dissipatitropha]
MNQKRNALVTGANSGLGKAITAGLAAEGLHVVMMCRNAERGEAARQDILAQQPDAAISLMICDLSSLEDIRRFSMDFCEGHGSLDILVNNAGLITPRRQESRDGYELQFAVNHLGHFLLTNLLLDSLKKSKLKKGSIARIINISSGAHKIGRIHFEDINLENKYRLWQSYAQSKLANLLFTLELAQRLEDTGAEVYAVHPGAVASQMGVNRETGFGAGIMRMLKPFFQSPEEAAATALFLATAPQTGAESGTYWYRMKQVKPGSQALNTDTAQRLWKISEEMIHEILDR